nr:F0F1 ATP synthase subunit beta [Ardenticatenia bacterium]
MAKGTMGQVVQIAGAVVDVAFPGGVLPEIYSALEVVRDDNNGGETENLVLETQQDLGNAWVRCVAMGSTEGLKRGLKVVDTGGPITVPVGPATLGRMFNVLGEPIDNVGPVETGERYPI